MNPRHIVPLIVLVFAAAANAADPKVILTVPDSLQVKSATAITRSMNLKSAGVIDATRHTITFEKLLPDTPYDIVLTLADGTELAGADMAWYGLDRSRPDVGPIDDEAKKEIEEIIQATKSFENKKRILFLKGDAQRITTLVELIRDTEFHASGANVVWRVELWYFKNEYGGWSKVQQVSKVLRRERFKDASEFKAAVSRIRWVPELGGVRVPKDKPELAVTLPAEAVPGAKAPPK